MAITKSVSPGSLPAPGGRFTFGVVATNTGTEAFTVVSLMDDVHGDLHGQGSCARGATVGPGQTYLCSFVASFTGSGGESETDVVTATVVDDERTQARAQARATASITAAAPGAVAVIPISKPTALAFTGSPVSGPVRAGVFLLLLGLLLVGASSRSRGVLVTGVGVSASTARAALFGVDPQPSTDPHSSRLRGLGLGCDER